MNLRRKRRADPEVNLTSLIDVVFLMLIFFMISTTFNREAELSIELPTASQEAKAVAEHKVVEIVIDAQGRYFINQQALVNSKPATVKAALAKAVGGRHDMPLVITADGRTPHQAVVTAMDAAGQLGLTRIAITTKRESGN